MTTEVALIPPDRIAHIKSSCEDLAYKPELSADEIEKMRQAEIGLMRPASDEWVRGRIATLLSHFYVTDMEDYQVAALADDWIAALRLGGEIPPSWALQAACIKWLATERNKPKPSDINELVRNEISWVYQVKSRLYLEDHPKAIAWHPMAKYKALADPGGDVKFGESDLLKLARSATEANAGGAE